MISIYGTNINTEYHKLPICLLNYGTHYFRTFFLNREITKLDVELAYIKKALKNETPSLSTQNDAVFVP